MSWLLLGLFISMHGLSMKFEIKKIVVLDQEFLPLFYILIHEGLLHDMIGV